MGQCQHCRLSDMSIRELFEYRKSYGSRSSVVDRQGSGAGYKFRFECIKMVQEIEILSHLTRQSSCPRMATDVAESRQESTEG
jgi:hypothetical protein